MTNSISELEHDADVILITGSNTTEMHPVLSSFIKRAVHAGRTKVIVADPRRIGMVDHAEIWLRQHGGTDVAWLNGLIHVIIAEDLYDHDFVDRRTEGFDELRQAVAEYTPERVEKISGIAGIDPHEVRTEDRAAYWFYMFRMRPDGFRCDRAEFVRALQAEGVSSSAGYIGVPLYGEPVFQQHGFFAGRWPVREFGLTEMDYTKHRCPEAEAILKTGVRIVIHEAMTEQYILDTATAIKKVARYYSV